MPLSDATAVSITAASPASGRELDHCFFFKWHSFAIFINEMHTFIPYKTIAARAHNSVDETLLFLAEP